MDLFNLISAPNPTKLKTGLRPHIAHEVPLLTATASRVIDMEDPDAATESSGTSSTIEKSPLDFDNENPSQKITEGVKEKIAVMGPPLSKKRRKRGNDGDDQNVPSKMLRKDHAASRSTQITIGGKSLASTGLEAGSTFFALAPQETPVDVRDPDPLSYATPPSIPEWDIAQSSHRAAVARDPDSEKSSSFTSLVGSRGNIYQPGWGVREEEIKKLDQEVHGLQNQKSNLKTILEAEADMKKAAEAKNADLTKELESLRTQFSDLHVNNHQLSQQVSDLQTQVTCKERIKAAFEEFKKYEDERVNSWCAKMDARLDALSIDFDEELYPHMLTAIAGRQWVIEHGLRLAVVKCGESPELRQAFANVVSIWLVKGMSEGLAHGIEHEKAGRDLEVVEAYDPEANSIYLQALQELKDLKYPIVDQLKGLKDAPMEVIMASLPLKSDSGEDAPKWIRDLRPSTSQLKIHVYPKEKFRVVCRTHEVGFAHHVRCDGIPVWVPAVAPQGLSILLTDAATQTETSEDDAWAEIKVGKLPQALEESLPHYKRGSVAPMNLEDGSTLLHVAAIGGKMEVVDILVKRNPELLLATDKEGHTPLALSVSNMHIKTSKCLFEHMKVHGYGALFEGQSGEELVVLAISCQDLVSLAEMIIKIYPDAILSDSDAVLTTLAQNFPCELNFWERRGDFMEELGDKIEPYEHRVKRVAE
uniref:Ankyrin repeat-containing domain, PGG domain protein n=1 Tax=Tanacetum cinerariifolium TaxID=118510 RepID=A0A6L2MIV6_TANCI|nr:ankyrin repeat-containing domain, PGG domain protein [Tanacetum cinerariifolium]